MTVVRTDKWLLDLYDKPLEMCERIKFAQPDVTIEEIYDYLIMNGMYRPIRGGEEGVKKLIENKVWKIVYLEEKKLKQEWDGPTIPIYIFPSDSRNAQITKEYNGKSGLAFKDKLFLFLSKQNTGKEIKALFTHEYNHICRLKKYKKNESDYTLGDTIILEGLAECAVKERFGDQYLAPYIRYYTESQLEEMWNTIIKPNVSIIKSTREHDKLLYGQKLLPKMVGYCVGYHLVHKKLMEQNAGINELLSYSTEEFIK
ncbi:Zn-dependent protease [Cytobacillus suaedae]|nr:Zn-dependent protease [Cytobacillus suaedae]